MKSNEENLDIENIKTLFISITQKEVVGISELKGGYAGQVFLITTKDGDVVFKLYRKENITSESVDDRVYSSNYRNLVSAHTLLTLHNVKTYELLAYGETSDYTYAVFSFLNGTEPNQDIINSKAYSKVLSTIHSITRDYQGWVTNDKPYEISWREAFVASIYNRLNDVISIIEPTLYGQIKLYLDTFTTQLKNPDFYVLSHLDGLQALFEQRNADWQLNGVIDIEDYQFTDQRFVLAGVTLLDKLGRYTLPSTFFNEYELVTKIGPTFKKFESLFQTYYLLTWIKVFQNEQIEQAKCISLLKKITFPDFHTL